MGIEVTFAHVDPNSGSETVSSMLYKKTTAVRSTSPIPTVSMQQAKKVSLAPLRPETTHAATTPTESSAPVRMVTATVFNPQTPADPAAGGTEGGSPLTRAGSSAPTTAARAATPALPVVPEPAAEEKPSVWPWVAGVGGGILVLGFFIRRRGR